MDAALNELSRLMPSGASISKADVLGIYPVFGVVNELADGEGILLTTDLIAITPELAAIGFYFNVQTVRVREFDWFVGWLGVADFCVGK